MKNFCELLATELYLNVVVNGTEFKHGLHDHLTFASTDSVSVDGIEILPRYQYLAVDNKLQILEPFYRWHHRASAQGWLLEPKK